MMNSTRPQAVDKLLEDCAKQWPTKTVICDVAELKRIAWYIEDLEFDLKVAARGHASDR